MKTTTYIAASVLLAAVVSVASGRDADGTTGAVRVFGKLNAYQTANIQRLEKYLLESLNHDVDGVVESALREVARMKLSQPGYQSDDLREKLNELSVEGRTASIRYKASLASILFEKPDMFVTEAPVDYATGEEMFTAIARRLEKELLTVNVF